MKNCCSRINIVVLLSVLSVYSLIFLLTSHQFMRLTADSMLYFSIAEKYLAGDFQNAVNGYWGPLLAWLIIPFLSLGLSDITIINILNLIIGNLLITGVWILSFRFELTDRIRIFILISLLPVALKFSIVQPMDFLLVCILVFYLAIIFSGKYAEKKGAGLNCGILGSLAYFTKAYAFPFFIVHFLIMNVFHYFHDASRDRRMKVLRNAIAGLVVFAFISGAWIMTISSKYDYFTFSTMRETNFNAPGPEVRGEGLEFGVPVFYEGFFAPPNETAFVVWEDPSYLRGKPWSAFQSMTHFKHFIKLTLKNIAEGLKIFESFSTFSMAIIIAFILFLTSRPIKKIFVQQNIVFPLFTLLLFSGGYVLFHFEERYLWLSNVLLLLMGGQMMAVLFKKAFFEPDIRKNMLIAAFVASFIFVPARFVLQTSNGSVDMEMHNLAMELERYDIKGNIASNRETGSHEAWHKTFRLAYWLDCRYYGQRGVNTDDEQLEKELDRYDMDYYFVWGELNNVPQFLRGKKEITGSEFSGLRIFNLKEERHTKSVQ